MRRRLTRSFFHSVSRSPSSASTRLKASMGRRRSAAAPRRARRSSPSPAVGAGRPFCSGRTSEAEPSSVPPRTSASVPPAVPKACSRASAPAPASSARMSRRSGFQAEEGSTVPCSVPPATEALTARPRGKRVSRARTRRRVSAEAAAGGWTITASASNAGGRKERRGALRRTRTVFRLAHQRSSPAVAMSRAMKPPRKSP